MSPALANRFPAYIRIFGGRQAARSIHFLMLVGFIVFAVVHVTLDRLIPKEHLRFIRLGIAAWRGLLRYSGR